MYVGILCLSSLLSLSKPKWAQAMCLGTRCGELAGRTRHLDRAPAHSIEVERDLQYNGAHWRLCTQRILTVPGELPQFSKPSLYGLSHLLCRKRSCLYKR